MAAFSSHASTSTAPWPAFYPPALKKLSDPRPHPNLSSLPPSRRSNGKYATLQDELDELEAEEDEFYNSVMDVQHYGYSWLVPLGKQNTHEEDVESAFSSSPRHDLNATFDLSGPSFGAPPGGATAGGQRDEGADEGGVVVDLDADIEDADASRSENGSASGVEDASRTEDEQSRRGGDQGGGEESMQM